MLLFFVAVDPNVVLWLNQEGHILLRGNQWEPLPGSNFKIVKVLGGNRYKGVAPSLKSIGRNTNCEIDPREPKP